MSTCKPDPLFAGEAKQAVLTIHSDVIWENLISESVAEGGECGSARLRYSNHTQRGLGIWQKGDTASFGALFFLSCHICERARGRRRGNRICWLEIPWKQLDWEKITGSPRSVKTVRVNSFVSFVDMFPCVKTHLPWQQSFKRDLLALNLWSNDTNADIITHYEVTLREAFII